jgi:hypothetical protein
MSQSYRICVKQDITKNQQNDNLAAINWYLCSIIWTQKQNCIYSEFGSFNLVPSIQIPAKKS